MVVKNLLGHVKQVEQFGIPDGVIHVQPLFSCCDDVTAPQDRQLLRKMALLNVQARAEIIDSTLSFPKLIQNSDAQRMGQSLEKLGLELANFTHRLIFIYYHISDRPWDQPQCSGCGAKSFTRSENAGRDWLQSRGRRRRRIEQTHHKMFIVTSEHSARPFIHQKDGVLSLRFGMGGAVQSEMRVDAPEVLVLSYTKIMMVFLLFIESPEHIGVIGLGGGSIQKHCYRHLSNTQISVAEISPEIIALRTRFLIPEDDHRFRVLCEDGAAFVKRHKSQFDVLLVDAFDIAGIPPHLCSPRFYDDCYHAMARNSILAVNFCDDFPTTSIEGIRQRFGGRVITVDAEDSANRIVLAGKGNIWDKSDDQLSWNRNHIEQNHAIDLRQTVRELLVARQSHQDLQENVSGSTAHSHSDTPGQEAPVPLLPPGVAWDTAGPKE